MIGKMVVDEGTIWQIGDGNNICVACDFWLLDYPNCLLSQPTDSKLCGLNMSYFLQDGQWNTLVVNMFFDEKLANDICKILVCKNRG